MINRAKRRGPSQRDARSGSRDYRWSASDNESGMRSAGPLAPAPLSATHEITLICVPELLLELAHRVDAAIQAVEASDVPAIEARIWLINRAVQALCAQWRDGVPGLSAEGRVS